MPDPSTQAQDLVELLAVVSSCDDEQTAIRAAVERAAETLQAEICGLVVGGAVVTAVGLPAGSPDYRVLATVRPGRGGTMPLPGLPPCATGAAMLGRPDEGMLVLGRWEEPFSVAEHNLIRGMARVLGLTLRMLRTLQTQRRQERLMRHLYEIQRSLSRRVPLDQVLSTTLAAVTDVIGGPAELWPAGGGSAVTRDAATLAATVTRTNAALDFADDRGRAGTAVPVHEHGRTVGALAAVPPAGRALDDADRENLLLFAEQVSLALSDAKTAQDMEAARRDGLTGLAGRALFHERLQRHLTDGSGAGQVALLFVDLDRFKAVNDTLGHAAGDLLLVEVARRLLGAVREGDMVGRLGGDEFAVVLSPACEKDAAEVAARIIDEVSRPYPMADGRTAEVGASVGIALATGDDEDRDLIRRADVAMYAAKRSGRGRWIVFRPDAPGDPLHAGIPAAGGLVAA
ncbi:diguanylate cyclase domain-containing protein [Actinoplanes sp. CA-030573]|uniref:diguanylate cyclase domain-containing protein n=1 Tax=Actinoplanes sp. CA-030573 TaxID=3239898 RepID=UPI003D8BDAE4